MADQPAVNGQVEVPTGGRWHVAIGGRVKVSTRNVGQDRLGFPPPLARASRIRNDSPSVTTITA
jgi:hypothetical protein